MVLQGIPIHCSVVRVSPTQNSAWNAPFYPTFPIPSGNLTYIGFWGQTQLWNAKHSHRGLLKLEMGPTLEREEESTFLSEAMVGLVSWLTFDSLPWEWCMLAVRCIKNWFCRVRKNLPASNHLSWFLCSVWQKQVVSAHIIPSPVLTSPEMTDQVHEQFVWSLCQAIV